MIQGFSDYEKTKVNNFNSEKLKLGGHYCKILEVSVETTVSKKTGNEYYLLKLKFDIDEPDESAGYFQRKFLNDTEKDPITAKWKGYYRLTIPNNGSEDYIKRNWKTFLTSIEKSNAGVKINGSLGFEETMLVGKKFGGVFGLEEYQIPSNGDVITFSKLNFIRSTEKIKDAKIPSVKLLNGTYMDYEKYINQGTSDSNNETSMQDTSSINDDDLPF